MIKLTHSIKEQLNIWQQEKLISPLDRHFAIEIAAIHQEGSELFILICVLLSKQLSAQHSCLDLEKIDFSNPLKERHSNCHINLNYSQLIDLLMTFSAIGHQNDNKPLIMDGHRLYLKRYFDFEVNVATKLRNKASFKSTDILESNQDNNQDQENRINQILACLYPSSNDEINWQKIATIICYLQQFSVITGGPGTGKTTTVTKLLLLIRLLQSKDIIIKLVAPTGKAAARLSESIKSSKTRLTTELKKHTDIIALDAINHIPEDASTLHRLLGVIPNHHQFRHHQDNPLQLDILIVDEASMVDLPMMHRLLNALPAHAKLILLGDQDQLASVEAGAVLADICYGIEDPKETHYSALFCEKLYKYTGYKFLAKNATDTALTNTKNSNIGLNNNICKLLKSHRFDGDAGIGILAKAVNQANIQEINSIWSQQLTELNWIENNPNQLTQVHFQKQTLGFAQLINFACDQYRHYLKLIAKNEHSAKDIIAIYNSFRVLCATRKGEYGVEGINYHIENQLQQAGLIKSAHEFYTGRPIIIQSNDYNLGLFNGDIGLILPDQQNNNRSMTYFVQPNGSVLKVLPARLPNHETCYAMTVHKSQGSEFAQVALVLPLSPSSTQQQLLTRELIYTAITRAKEKFICLGTKAIFNRACKQKTQRQSGLADRLWY